jgi:TetR/AcrR family transcriptional regulator, transcriptional repressor of bet genes
MARKSLMALRRREFQKAAYDVAYAYGFSGLTVERVTREAGTSKGVIHHYFDSKHQLIEYATRYAHGILAKAARRNLTKAKTPSERLWAIIDANFLPEILTPPFFRLWFEALDNQRLLYLVAILERRMRSNLIFALKQLGRAKDAGDLAYSIMNMYDGFWALASVEVSLTRDLLLESIAGYVKDLVPSFDMRAVDFLKKNSF